MARASTLALVCLVAALALNFAVLSKADSLDFTRENTAAEFQQWKEFREFQEFQTWKRAKEAKKKNYWNEGQRRFDKKMQWMKRDKDVMDPPPIDSVALMARYIVNQADWTAIATVSSRKDTLGYPFVNVVSLSDGPLGNGTGIPYMYLTPLDFTAQDAMKDNRATLTVSLAQGSYCQKKNYDPMDPRCARVVFSGKIKEIKEENPEFPTGQGAIFGRHPWLAHMPADHHFFVAKLKIATIAVLDTFGGPRYVTMKDYLNPPNTEALKDYALRYDIEESEYSEPEIYQVQTKNNFWLV